MTTKEVSPDQDVPPKKASKKNTRSNNSRVAVLHAAERVVQKLGPGRLTIDAVVTESGMSKGGILYHFPSKSALVEGMINHMVEESNRRVAQLVEQLEGEANPTVRALIEVQGGSWVEEQSLSRALMAAAAQDPEHIGKVRDNKRLFVERMQAESQDSDDAILLWLAADCMAINKVLNISCFTDEEEKRLHARLLSLVDKLSAKSRT
ncbi:TetR/AcrR family transcriptional regulator [Pseudomaricurvus alkylphenolicus]|uniref:TetR/AcrR family transcriptional regulator n=1 Tax=Pseudomaricurvus alkylphenolicus TaxID=1306991 RepID=UPI0014249FBD|nr:TetR/AcrR family transcriptional regulator [Pseudomaricurvus alkylphenolicus]NIB38051.1 TetR/AcrR family transcriptional regulator [Pseudomaricurvus alkylphenolicus]